MYKGVDISGWNHTKPIDWSALHDSDVKFVIEKITEGTDYVNPYFTEDCEAALKQGFVYDAYIFWHPSQELSGQIGYARSHLLGTNATPELDLELIEGKAWSQLAEQAIAYLRAEPKALLYSNTNFLENMAYTQWPADCRIDRLWFAYPDLDINPTDLPYHPLIWQYSWTGTVDGIEGSVDLDYFLNEAKFPKWASIGKITTPPTTVKDTDMISFVKEIGTEGPVFIVMANPIAGEVGLIKKVVTNEVLTAGVKFGIPFNENCELVDLNAISTVA